MRRTHCGLNTKLKTKLKSAVEDKAKTTMR